MHADRNHNTGIHNAFVYYIVAEYTYPFSCLLTV
jgi:hypothetical protein